MYVFTLHILVCVYLHPCFSFFFSAIGHFKASADVYINATEGNVAVVPCDPPSGEPFSITVFEVNSTTIDRSTGKNQRKSSSQNFNL